MQASSLVSFSHKLAVPTHARPTNQVFSVALPTKPPHHGSNGPRFQHWKKKHASILLRVRPTFHVPCPVVRPKVAASQRSKEVQDLGSLKSFLAIDLLQGGQLPLTAPKMSAPTSFNFQIKKEKLHPLTVNSGPHQGTPAQCYPAW